MKIHTTRFGEIRISKDEIIDFPQGILGFPSERRYVILREDNGPFYWMQSVENPALAFVITNPLVFVPDYKIRLHRSQLEDIGLTELSNGEIWVLVSIRKNPLRVTLNLQGPILVNRINKKAKQVVLDPEEYPLQFEVLRVETQREEEAVG